MVLTRNMSNNVMSGIEETFTNYSSLDEETEPLVSNMCFNLKRLRVNFPEIDLTDIELDISNLLQVLDKHILNKHDHEKEVKELMSSIKLLEVKLETEKKLRRSDMNDSFNQLDVAREENNVLLKEKDALSSVIVHVQSKVENLSA